MARRAYAPLRRIASSVKASDNNQVLTETDTAIAAFLIERIRNTFPQDAIIEE